MKRKLFIISSAFLILLLITYGLFELSKSRTFQLFGEITARVPAAVFETPSNQLLTGYAVKGMVL